jgi:two-component system nitrogen regulation sensor histidine kinase NtrY
MASSRRRKLSHERRVLLMAFLAGLPGALATMALLRAGDYSGKAQWTLGLLVIGAWLAFAFAVQENVIRPLQTISNLLAALREEDFSFRARGTRGDDALAQAMLEVNALAKTLREQRLGALEATALLRKVMEEIDVAVFAFDDEQHLVLVNRSSAGARKTWASAIPWGRPSRARARRHPWCWTWRCPAGPDASRSGAARSAKAGSPTACSSSPM